MNHLQTTIKEVYSHHGDKEAGISPLFRFKVEVFDAQENVIIQDINVSYQIDKTLTQPPSINADG